MKKEKDIFQRKEIKIISVVFIILVGRLVVPLEFPISYSIYVTTLYAQFCRILRDVSMIAELAMFS